MIKLQDLTPAIYYNQSRDFQFIGRLYDIILNWVKTDVDTIYALPIGVNVDERLLNLLALTLGFQSKHHYNTKHLKAVCSVLPYIMRNKGSLNSIETVISAILNAEGILEEFSCTLQTNNLLEIQLPPKLADTTLLNDLLWYIVPAGLSCAITKEIRQKKEITTQLEIADKVTIYKDDNKKPINPQELGILLKLKKDPEAEADSNITTDMDLLLQPGARDNKGILMNIEIPKISRQ